jgi:micrococcal nuclease
VIDGDTVLIEGGYSVRLLGIDADERGYPCYSAAKERLGEMVLGKEVRLEKAKEDKDQWCRYLRYIFVGDVNVGLELVKEGLVVARASAEDNKYQEEIALAEKLAIDNKIGCKWSGQGAVESDRDGSDRGANYQWSRLTPELTDLKVVEACLADKYYGQEVIVEGWMADGYRSKTNTVFLNFERAYPNQCFTTVIFSSDQYRFIQNPEEYYANQMVRVRGEIKEYKGKPEIILKKAEQIERGKAL